MCNCNKKNSIVKIRKLAKQFAITEKTNVAIYMKAVNDYDFVDYDYAVKKGINVIEVIKC